MNNVLVLPDIHGRKFWIEPCRHINEFDKVIFFGDYLDPYNFEDISVENAIENFKEIIEFKKNNMDKVVLLLGNHDLPYYSEDYFKFSDWHCRHANFSHKKIHILFEENKDLFKIAHVENDIIFTHAGIESGWLNDVVKCNSSDINEICDEINQLSDTVGGLRKLFQITSERGGRDRFGSCVWTDVHDIIWDIESLENPNTIIRPIHKIKQIFGHTMQAFYGKTGDIEFGNAIEFGNCKMLDCAKAFVLDVENFTVKVF